MGTFLFWKSIIWIGIFKEINLKSLEKFKKAIELDGTKGTYYNNQALSLYHLGDLHGALDSYNKAIERDPDDSR